MSRGPMKVRARDCARELLEGLGDLPPALASIIEQAEWELRIVGPGEIDGGRVVFGMELVPNEAATMLEAACREARLRGLERMARPHCLPATPFDWSRGAPRASGDASCPSCLMPYRKHPPDNELSFLTVLCDGDRVKL